MIDDRPLPRGTIVRLEFGGGEGRYPNLDFSSTIKVESRIQKW